MLSACASTSTPSNASDKVSSASPAVSPIQQPAPGITDVPASNGSVSQAGITVCKRTSDTQDVISSSKSSTPHGHAHPCARMLHHPVRDLSATRSYLQPTRRKRGCELMQLFEEDISGDSSIHYRSRHFTARVRLPSAREEDALGSETHVPRIDPWPPRWTWLEPRRGPADDDLDDAFDVSVPIAAAKLKTGRRSHAQPSLFTLFSCL